MGGNQLEELENQFNQSIQLIEKRRVYFLTELMQFRLEIRRYFCNESLLSNLKETPKGEEMSFEWEPIQEGMAACLVTEEKLVTTAANLSQQGQRCPCIIPALDHYITESGLPLKKTQQGYEFTPPLPYTPKAQSFMIQFAQILTIYRVFLGIYEIYFSLLQDECLNMVVYQNCLEQAKAFAALTEELNDDPPLTNLFLQAKGLKKEVKDLFETVRHGLDAFQHTISLQTSELIKLFHLGALGIEQAYKEHPNASWVWFVKDSSWQILLKELAGKLFNKLYCTYSTYSGTLTIDNSFIVAINGELNQLFTTAVDIGPYLRIAMLSKALALLDQSILNLRVEAAKRGVSLREPVPVSVLSFFAGNKNAGDDAFFAVMRKFIPCSQKHPQGIVEDAEPESESYVPLDFGSDN